MRNEIFLDMRCNLIDLKSKLFDGTVSVHGLFHIVSKAVAHEHMLCEIVHMIAVTEPGKGVAAVVGRVFLAVGGVKHIELL